MNKYKITIYNGSDVLVYQETITAKDENDAVLKVLNDIILYCDDTIKIEEN